MAISPYVKRIVFISLAVFFAAVFLFWAWIVYIPYSFQQVPELVYVIEKGAGVKNIATDLEQKGIIKNRWVFLVYTVLSGQKSKLQAGSYSLSGSISIAQLTQKFSSGDVIKNTITVIEGWDLKDIGNYLEEKKMYEKKDFLEAAAQDFSESYEFLKDLPPARAGGAQAGKPKKSSLEGYLFPDTYQLPMDAPVEDLVKKMLDNFDKKLTPELRQEIAAQHKSIFQVVTMASIIEKEVQSTEDKKMVSGILWKRIENNMGLQADSTINYITGKNQGSASIQDTKIDSPYNTYKYRGLPLGPISNPGLDSIMAAIYPTKSLYWYYLSAKETGQTIFSKTLEEHNVAAAKYLR